LQRVPDLQGASDAFTRSFRAQVDASLEKRGFSIVDIVAQQPADAANPARQVSVFRRCK
jgi:hypothetical protein